MSETELKPKTKFQLWVCITKWRLSRRLWKSTQECTLEDIISKHQFRSMIHQVSQDCPRNRKLLFMQRAPSRHRKVDVNVMKLSGWAHLLEGWGLMMEDCNIKTCHWGKIIIWEILTQWQSTLQLHDNPIHNILWWRTVTSRRATEEDGILWEFLTQWHDTPLKRCSKCEIFFVEH